MNRDNQNDELEQALAVARSYMESFASGDPDTIADHVAEQFVNEHTAALGSGCVGKSEYRRRLPDFLADMQRLKYQVEDLIASGSNDEAANGGVRSIRVAVFYTMTAEWQGDSPIQVRGVQRLAIENGLINHRTDYWDSAVFLTQVSEEARAALAPFGIRSASS